MTDAAVPDADEFDEELAEALSAANSEDNVRHNARLVAAYYTTLVDNGVSEDNATEITCLWLSHSMGGDE